MPCARLPSEAIDSADRPPDHIRALVAGSPFGAHTRLTFGVTRSTFKQLPERLTTTLPCFPSFEVVRCAAAEPAGGGGGEVRGVEFSAASGVGVLPNTAAAPGMERAGSCGQLEGGTKLDHYAGRLSIGGRPHYLAPDGPRHRTSRDVAQPRCAGTHADVVATGCCCVRMNW